MLHATHNLPLRSGAHSSTNKLKNGCTLSFPISEKGIWSGRRLSPAKRQVEPGSEDEGGKSVMEPLPVSSPASSPGLPSDNSLPPTRPSTSSSPASSATTHDNIVGTLSYHINHKFLKPGECPKHPGSALLELLSGHSITPSAKLDVLIFTSLLCPHHDCTGCESQLSVLLPIALEHARVIQFNLAPSLPDGPDRDLHDIRSASQDDICAEFWKNNCLAVIEQLKAMKLFGRGCTFVLDRGNPIVLEQQEWEAAEEEKRKEKLRSMRKQECQRLSELRHCHEYEVDPEEEEWFQDQRDLYNSGADMNAADAEDNAHLPY